MLKKLVVSVLSLIIITGFTYAGTKGSASALFLKISPDARGTAMGESLTALSDDVNAVHWNPAGLGFASGIQVSFTHLVWIFDTSYDYVAGSYALKSIGTFGLSAKIMTLPDIEYRESITGPIMGKVGNGDLSIGLSYGKDLNSILPLSVGLTAKYISSKYADVSGSGIGCDIGGIFTVNKSIKAGFSLQNIGTKIKYEEYEYSLPMVIKIGAAYIIEMAKPVFGCLKQINTAISLDIPKDNDFEAHIGTEGIFKNFASNMSVAVRLGVSYPRENGFISYLNFGAGIIWKIIQLDYAFGNMGDAAGNTHRISLGAKF